MDIKTAIGERIKAIRSKNNLSGEAFGEMLGMSRAGVSAIEKGNNYPSIETLLKICQIFNEDVKKILTGESHNEADNNYYHKPQPIIIHDEERVYRPVKELVIPVSTMPRVIAVDRTGRELITHVPIAARAGYLEGFNDPHFIESLPAYSMPMIHGAHRSFDVKGYSMLTQQGKGLYPSDVAFGRAVESYKDIRDGRVYIIIANTEWEDGIIVKRCINRLDSDGKLICNSDNRNSNFPPIVLHAEQIKEVWEYKGHFTRQLPGPGDFDRQFNDLQAKMAMLYEDFISRTGNSHQISHSYQKKI